MIVRELITRIGFQINNTQLSKVDSAVNNLKTAADKASSSADKAVSKINKNAAAAASGLKKQGSELASMFRNIAATYLTFEGLKSITNVADEMQSIRARLSVMPQLAGETDKAFEKIENRASKIGVSIDAYSKLFFRTGMAVKDTVKDSEELFTFVDTVSKALVVGGASASETNSVITQLTQALGSRRLQGDEFRSLIENAPLYVDMLSEAMEIPRDKLKEFSSQGKITTDLIVAGTLKISKNFDDLFLKIPMTVGRALTVSSNKFKLTVDRINRETGFINRAALWLLKTVEKVEKGVYAVRDAFGSWEKTFRFIASGVAVFSIMKLVTALNLLKVSGWAALLPFLKLLAIGAALALVFDDVWAWIEGKNSLIGEIVGPFKEWEGVLSVIAQMLKGIVLSVGEMIKLLAGAVRLAIALKNIIVGVATWDMSQVNRGADVIKGGIQDFLKMFENESGNPPKVAPQITPQKSLLPSQNNGNKIESSTNVYLTVPPGTTAEQGKFLMETGKEVFKGLDKERFNLELGAYSP